MAGPGIRFPPPFLFVGGFLAAWLLNRQLPFEIDGAGAGALQTTAGAGLLAVGLAVMASGLVTFVRHRTSVIPHHAARELVRTGPYRFSRNPMYLGLTLAYAGLALTINWAWPFVVLPIVILLLSAFVIAREERYLRSAFGVDYESYCRRVRRWL
jgi:protein-S-isoprenylcysteine O-methyltransferase Ste14